MELLYALEFFCIFEIMVKYVVLVGDDVTSFDVTPTFCLPKLKSITVLLYDFSTVNGNFLLARL